MRIKFGYHVDEEQYPPSILIGHASLAVAQGFEFLCIDDHFHPWFHTGGCAGHAWIWLAAAGTNIQGARLGTGVTTCIYRYNPAIVAQAFATLDVLYPGRIYLALGTGEALNEMPMAGVGSTWPPHAERLERTVEAVRIIKSLWEGDFIDFRGKYFQLSQAKLYTKPVERIPIYFAASGPKAMEMAGMLGDGLLTNGSEERISGLFPLWEEGVRKSGRSPADLPKMIEVNVSYDEDYAKALASVSKWLPVKGGNDIPDPRELDRLRIGLNPEKMASSVYTDVDEIIRKVEKVIRCGFDEIEIGSSSPNEEKFLREFGKKALPYLRETYQERD